MLLVQGSHRGASRRNDVVDEEEQSIFRSEVNPLANQKVKLAYSQV